MAEASEALQRAFNSFEEQEDNVKTLRDMIDDVDQDIMSAIKYRIALSKRIGGAKAFLGQPRVDINREGEILLAYSARLGYNGKDIGKHILDLCKQEPIVG